MFQAKAGFWQSSFMIKELIHVAVKPSNSFTQITATAVLQERS
jgi:hypothetical protein